MNPIKKGIDTLKNNVYGKFAQKNNTDEKEKALKEFVDIYNIKYKNVINFEKFFDNGILYYKIGHESTFTSVFFIELFEAFPDIIFYVKERHNRLYCIINRLWRE